MSEKDKEDKKDRIEEKTIIEKTEIISNTNSQVANFQFNQIDTPSLLNITKFKEYQILRQLDIFSNFSDLFLTKKEYKYYILKLYRMGIKLDELVLSKIKSLNPELIVNIIDYGFDNQLKRYYIIEEYYSLGSLSNFIKNNYELIRNNYKVIDSIIEQLNEVIYLLHKNEILHKDIKSSNILIKEIIRNEQGDIEDIIVVISDFNISSMIPTEASKKITEGVKGTILYMPPESFSKVITKKSDYWSLGMILYELLFRNLPFENIDTNIVIYKILTEDIQISKEVPRKYQILLRGLFIRNPEKRFYYEEVKKVLNAKDAKQLEKIEEELLIPLFSQGLNKKAEFKAEFDDKVIIYNNKQYKNIDELIKEVEKDTNIFYSIVKIIEDGSYKELFDKEDIKKIDYYLKKLNNIELAVSLFISEKNGEFNLYGIKLNQNKLVEICKKYLDSTDLNELTAQELNIIKLIKNYYLKKVNDYNIFDVYEISKEKDIGLNKIFEIIKRIELDISNIDYIFPFIISLVEKEISTIDFIIEKKPEIFKYWAKVLGKEKLKNILYNSSKKDIVELLILKVFSKEELKEILYESIGGKKENITDFLVSKVFSKEELKEILYESIEAKKENITEFLVSKVFSKDYLKEILYDAINGDKKDITELLVFKVFNKQEIQEIFDESINKNRLKVVVFLIFNVFNNNKIEELFNKDILDELVRIKDEHNRTILHYAVLQNKIDLVKFLLSNYWGQIDANLEDNFGYTAKDYAQNNKVITKIFNCYRKLIRITALIYFIIYFILGFIFLPALFVPALFTPDVSILDRISTLLLGLLCEVLFFILFTFILGLFVKLILKIIFFFIE
jgi:serine/threonine protein kinase